MQVRPGQLRRLASAALALIVVAAVLISPLPAYALSNCTVVKQIFMRGESAISNTRGTDNKIFVRSRNLDTSCKAHALSTAHINRGGAPQDANWGDWVEMGWDKQRYADGSVDLCIFTEWGDNFSVLGGRYICNPSGLNYSEYDFYRVVYSGTEWLMQTDLNLDGNYQTRDGTGNDITWTHGAAMGETEKKGNDTGMDDDQRSLSFKNDNAASWQDCRGCTASMTTLRTGRNKWTPALDTKW